MQRSIGRSVVSGGGKTRDCGITRVRHYTGARLSFSFASSIPIGTTVASKNAIRCITKTQDGFSDVGDHGYKIDGTSPTHCRSPLTRGRHLVRQDRSLVAHESYAPQLCSSGQSEGPKDMHDGQARAQYLRAKLVKQQNVIMKYML